jgi:SAM-dependent methyltransferase
MAVHYQPCPFPINFRDVGCLAWARGGASIGSAMNERAPGGMAIYDDETGRLLASQNRDPLLRQLTDTLVALALAYAPPSSAGSAIDVGCGVGRTTLALARRGYRVVGIDPSQRIVALAHAAAEGQRAEAAFHVGDATAGAPEPWHEAFGLAVCSEVIEHVAEPARVIGYLRQVLRPRGILLLTTPHRQDLWTVMDDYAGHVRRFSTGELLDLLADFQVLELSTEGFPFQRLVMTTYSRMAERGSRQHEFAAYGDSPAYRAYRAVMPLLLKVDHVFRRWRRGTTLVAVARRRG